MFRKPKITDSTTDPHECIEEGQKASASVMVTAWPIPQITWYKDGEELSNLEHFGICTEDGEYTKTSILTKEAMTLEDSGKYHIVAKNKHGKHTCDIDISGKRLAVVIPFILHDHCSV